MPSSLLKIEWTHRQGIWNQRSSRHDPESWALHPPDGILPIKGHECCEKRGIEHLESRLAAHSMSGGELERAGDGPRTRYLNLGKVALYQVSYSRAAASDFRRYVFSTTPSDAGAPSA